ncbi:Uncharacterized protein TCM_033667 [Theobroma cacao]|uniref:Uncharacterized protein n=1 Tax=Theobroma cacao TaxID=3641 RepID=A0A061FBA0_THECC|nr:Uncharacterized protein TCM_033667 [Theobroma cacao]
MLADKTVAEVDIDIAKHEKKSSFLRPRHESPRVEKANPPSRHPMKKDDEGKPVMIELAHSRRHSETIVLSEGPSQDQELLERLQMSKFELQVVSSVQCHVGTA